VTEFALLGEPLAIELANTILVAGGERRDVLGTDADAAAWVRAHEGDLPGRAADQPPAAADLRALRVTIRRLVFAAIDGERPRRGDLAHLNATSAAAPPIARLRWTPTAPPTAIDAAAIEDPAAATLAAIARSAIALLGGPDRDRLRRCDGQHCILVFVAAHPRRRWCSPAVCGNRARVARHYRRHRAA